MKKFVVKFNDANEVQEFVQLAEKRDVNGELKVGSYSIDPRSLLGMLALDFRKTFQFIIYDESTQLVDANEAYRKFLSV